MPNTGVTRQRLKSSILNMFKKYKKATSKELKESVKAGAHQVGNISMETEIIFKKN